MTYTLDWSETNLGGSAVVSYGSGAILDFTDKPSGATSALSLTSHQSDGVDNILAEFTIETSGSSVMTFDYKVSTESGWDKFHIDVDGVSQANYSGLVAWTTHAGISIPSAGTHTIRFRYTKDSGGAVNDDRVWVALLNITNTTTVNDASGTVTTYDMEDGAIPSVVTTSTWTNSTSEPIAGTRSLRSPAAPANSGTYDLQATKAAGTGYRTLGFNFKVSSEAGWDKLFLFPNASASNVPATGSPTTAGAAGWLDWSGTASGRLAVILPAAASTILLRYTKDGGGAGGSDAAWVDTLSLPAASGTTTVGASRATTWNTKARVTPTRATTWRVRATVAGSRATTWRVRTAVASTRATTWRALARVTPTRATTWDTRATLAASRATTWDVRTSTSTTRATTWRVRATATSQRSTTWNVASTLTTVTATRATTWSTRATVTPTRATTWQVKAAVAASRATTWDTLARIERALATSWDVRTTVAGQRSTSWRARAQVTGSRATTWNVASDVVIVTPAERTVVTPAESRTVITPAESRTVVTPAEHRQEA